MGWYLSSPWYDWCTLINTFGGKSGRNKQQSLKGLTMMSHKYRQSLQYHVEIIVIRIPVFYNCFLRTIIFTSLIKLLTHLRSVDMLIM